MNTEKLNAMLTALAEMRKAVENMNTAVLGDADECPEGFEWWDTALDALDTSLCDVEHIMVNKYRVLPETFLMRVLNA